MFFGRENNQILLKEHQTSCGIQGFPDVREEGRRLLRDPVASREGDQSAVELATRLMGVSLESD